MRILLVSLVLLFETIPLFSQTSADTIKPSYKQGDANLYKFLGYNVNYPFEAKNQCKQGTVILKFLIDTSGTIDSISVFQSVHSTIDNETIRVLKLTSGKWNPARINDSLISTYHYLPFKFSLPGCISKEAANYYNIGVKYFEAKEYQLAYDQFLLAIKLNTTDIDALYNAAICKIKLGETEEACKFLRRIKKCKKNDADELLKTYCQESE